MIISGYYGSLISVMGFTWRHSDPKAHPFYAARAKSQKRQPQFARQGLPPTHRQNAYQAGRETRHGPSGWRKVGRSHADSHTFGRFLGIPEVRLK